MTAYGAKLYESLTTETGIVDADPHRLIQLLFAGAVARVAAAKGHIERKEHAQKAKQLGSAIAIVGCLQGSLDNKVNHELVANLEKLYDYIIRRLFEATIKNDIDVLDEVLLLLNKIKASWDEIRPEIADDKGKDVPSSSSQLTV